MQIHFAKRFLTSVLACSLAGVSASALADKDPIRVGIPTALTGPYGDLGNQVQRAVNFAVEEANAAGGVDGRKVEARFLDTQGKADAARQQGEKLALAGYNLLMGTIASGEGLALAPMLNRWNALYISSINKANEITGKECNARMFRVNKPDSSDAAVVKPWLTTRTEKKWAVIAADSAWGRNSGASFKSAVQATGKELVSEAYPPFGSNDYAPYIQAINDSGAQGVWVALAGRDAINFATQAKQFGLLNRVFTAGVSFVTDNTVKTLGDVSKGIWGVINYSSTLDTHANKQFVQSWEKKYPGTTPSNFEGESYMAMQVLFQAVKRAGSVKPGDVSKAMSGATFDTILGQVLMRKEDHQLVVPNYFGEVGDVDGTLKPIIKISVPADVATLPADGSCKLAAN